jgi:hypothetical protein
MDRFRPQSKIVIPVRKEPEVEEVVEDIASSRRHHKRQTGAEPPPEAVEEPAAPVKKGSKRPVVADVAEAKPPRGTRTTKVAAEAPPESAKAARARQLSGAEELLEKPSPGTTSRRLAMISAPPYTKLIRTLRCCLTVRTPTAF